MRIFVNNLPWDFTAEDLKKLFEPVAKVQHSKIIYDQFNGYSRGFGFVELIDKHQAEQAIQELKGTKIKNQQISFSIDDPRKLN